MANNERGGDATSFLHKVVLTAGASISSQLAVPRVPAAHGQGSLQQYQLVAYEYLLSRFSSFLSTSMKEKTSHPPITVGGNRPFCSKKQLHLAPK